MDSLGFTQADSTGYGTTSTGLAPSFGDRQEMAARQTRTQQAIDLYAAKDYYARQMVNRAAQFTVGQGNQDAGQFASGTAGGQAMQHMAMLARVTGNLGHGNPVNYAANLQQAVGSGFGVTMAAQGMKGSPSYATGNNALSQQVGAALQTKILDGVYGAGAPDPSKASGMNQEGVAQILAQHASKYGLGDIATVKRNASLEDRMKSYRDQAAPDAQVDSELDKATKERLSEGEMINRATDIAKSNPKAAKALRDISRRGDAVLINDVEVKKLTDMATSVAKGIGGLRDMYEGLNDAQLQQKMQQLSGVIIKDEVSAKKAAGVVNRMRGAAEQAGLDPKALAGFIESSGMMDPGRLGFTDPRDAKGGINLSNGVMGDIATKTALAKAAAKRNGDTSFDEGGFAHHMAGTAATFSEGASDFLTLGGMAGNAAFKNNKRVQSKYAELLEKQRNNTDGLAGDMDISDEANQLLTEMGMDETQRRRFKGQFDGATLNSMAARSARADSNSFSAEKLASSGISVADPEVTDLLNTKVGAHITDLLADPEKFLGDAGKMGVLDSEQADKLRQFAEANKGADASGVVEMARQSNTRGLSEYDDKMSARMSLEKADSGQVRGNKDDGKGFDLRSLLNSLVGAKGNGMDNDTAALATAQELAANGYNVGNVGEIDITQGVTAEHLDALDKSTPGLSGRLAEKLKYKDRDAMLAAMSDPEKRFAFGQAVKESDELIAGGTDGKIKFMEKGQGQELMAKGIDKRLAAASAALTLQKRPVGERTAQTDDIMAGRELGAGSMFDVAALKNGNWSDSVEGYMNLDGEGAQALNEVSGGKLAGGMRAQRDQLLKASESGTSTVHYTDKNGENKSEYIKDVIAKLDDTLGKLDPGSKGGGGTTTEHVTFKTAVFETAEFRDKK